MKKIAIFGAGGFAKEVACTIAAINGCRSADNKYDLIGFFDDKVKEGTKVSHYGQVLGGMSELNTWPEDLAIVIAIGNPKNLRDVRNRITNKRIQFPNVIHPSFCIVDKKTFSIGEGNIIQANCKVSCDTSIGSFNVLNGYVVMGHDSQIGDFNVLMPSIRVSGEVAIGEGNFLGVGSIVLQGLKIGHDVRLSAGAVLMTKPKNGGIYIGNPAKLFNY